MYILDIIFYWRNTYFMIYFPMKYDIFLYIYISYEHDILKITYIMKYIILYYVYIWFVKLIKIYEIYIIFNV